MKVSNKKLLFLVAVGLGLLGLGCIFLIILYALNPPSRLASGEKTAYVRGYVSRIFATGAIWVEGEFPEGRWHTLVVSLSRRTRVYQVEGERVVRIRDYILTPGMRVDVSCNGTIFQTDPPQCEAEEILIWP